MKNKIFNAIIELNCLKFGDFTLKSGAKSDYYINLRNLVRRPDIIKLIAQLIYTKLDNIEEPYLICGLPYAGLPYANCLSTVFNIPLIVLRKEQKKYGMKNMIDGLEDNTLKNVIIIDDIITSGSSINESLKYFKENDLNIIKQ